MEFLLPGISTAHWNFLLILRNALKIAHTFSIRMRFKLITVISTFTAVYTYDVINFVRIVIVSYQ